MTNVRVHPEAESEVAEAARWYMKRRFLYWVVRLADVEDDLE
jgi:hypothetical protein